MWSSYICIYQRLISTSNYSAWFDSSVLIISLHSRYVPQWFSKVLLIAFINILNWIFIKFYSFQCSNTDTVQVSDDSKYSFQYFHCLHNVLSLHYFDCYYHVTSINFHHHLSEINRDRINWNLCVRMTRTWTIFNNAGEAIGHNLIILDCEVRHFYRLMYE